MGRVPGSQRPIERALEGRLGQEIRQNYPEPERRANLSFAEFDEKYWKPKKPVIITDLTEKWPAKKLWNFDYLRKTCGSTKVLANSYTGLTSPIVFNKLIDEILSFDPTLKNGEKPPYLQEWYFSAEHPELLSDFAVPSLFQNEWMSTELKHLSCKLWIGAKGATTFIHQDGSGTHTWHAHLHGKKEWFFFGPKAPHPSQVTEANMHDFLKNPETSPMHFTLNPGEVVYIPKGWWHRVKTVESSVCLSTSMLDAKDVPEFVRSHLITGFLGWLNQDILKKNDPGMYALYKERARLRATIFGLDPSDILGLEKKEYFNTVTDLIKKKVS